MPKISVLLPVYNAERYLRECLDSLRNQAFSDFVCLAADDCSSDSSLEILNEYASRDSRFRVLANPRNLGVAETLNRLLEAADASVPFVARMDADDISEPDRFRLQYDFLAAHPEICAVGSWLTVIDSGGDVLGLRRYPVSADAVGRRWLCGNPIPHPALLLRTDALLRHGGYREYGGVEDYDLWLRMAAAGERMANLEQPLLRYRINPGQVKQRQLKSTLRNTMALQRRYLFRRGFFSIPALCYTVAGHMLLLLPGRMIMKLFQLVSIRPTAGADNAK